MILLEHSVRILSQIHLFQMLPLFFRYTMKKNRRFYLTVKAWMFRDVSWASLFLFLLISTNMATIEGENISTTASSSSSTVTSSTPSTSPGSSTSTPKTMTDWKAFRTKPGLPQA